jgi:hypothetical protein
MTPPLFFARIGFLGLFLSFALAILRTSSSFIRMPFWPIEHILGPFLADFETI